MTEPIVVHLESLYLRKIRLTVVPLKNSHHSLITLFLVCCSLYIVFSALARFVP